MNNFSERFQRLFIRLRPGVRRISNWIEYQAQRFTNMRWSKRAIKIGVIRIPLILILLIAFLAPTFILLGSAYSQYTQLKGLASDAAGHLSNIKTIVSNAAATPVPIATGTPSVTPTATAGGTNKSGGIQDKAKNILTIEVLTQIKQQSDAAHEDFARILTAINQKQGFIGFALISPFAGKITSTEKLAEIGLEATSLGSKLTLVGMDFTTTFQTSPFSPDGQPLLTQKSFADVQQAVQDILTSLTLIQGKVNGLQLSDLPVNTKQRAQIAEYLPKLPDIINQIKQYQPYLPLAGWALGVDTERNYLIQTMDRSELRPSGGFNGSYGILTLNGGRLGNISLTDVTLVDYSTTNKVAGQLAPELYRKWWPYPNWGLRDANLSGDFPTSAQLSRGTFTKEVGTQINGGAISFSPLVIEHLLDPKILGPIQIPCYDDIVTSTNLEEILHYYQLSPEGVAKQDICSANNTATSKRKRFTSALASALQDRVRAATSDTTTLKNILDSIGRDLVSKDLQIYVKNPDIEALLTKDHHDASMNRDPAIDATYMVQANIGASKGTPFADIKATEDITLDAQGGATHKLTVQTNYHPTSNIYGYATYRDYVRVYVPPQAQFVSGTGFDRQFATPLCYLATPDASGKLPDPTIYKATGVKVPYASVKAPCQPYQSAACPGYFNPGETAYTLPNLLGSDNTHIDDIGAPMNFSSDEPSRAMFGGLVITPDFCRGVFTLQWYVPHVVGTGSQPYTFLTQRQSGTLTDYTVTIHPASGSQAKTVSGHQAPLLKDCTWSSDGKTTCP